METATNKWATTIADVARARDGAATQAEGARLAQLANFRAAVEAGGVAYFKRLAAAVGTGCRAFNVAAQAAVIEAPRVTETGPGFSVRAGQQGFLLVVPYLRTDDLAPTPGCSVRTRVHGRDSVRVFDFALAGGALAMRCDGDALDADTFAERMAAPWLAALELAPSA